MSSSEPKRRQSGCRKQYTSENFYNYLGELDITKCVLDDLHIILSYLEIEKVFGRVMQSNKKAYIILINEKLKPHGNGKIHKAEGKA